MRYSTPGDVDKLGIGEDDSDAAAKRKQQQLLQFFEKSDWQRICLTLDKRHMQIQFKPH